MPKAKKSGYGEKPPTFIGMLSLKKVWIDLWISESKQELQARATLAVPRERITEDSQ